MMAMIAPLHAAELPGWTADLVAAQARAKTEKKAVLVEFTGSDWCPPCMAMRKNVFSKPEFVKEASKNFILVEIDMPEGDQALRAKNEPTVEKFKIDGFPMVVLLNENGKEFGRFFASEHPTTERFLQQLQKSLEKKDMD